FSWGWLGSSSLGWGRCWCFLVLRLCTLGRLGLSSSSWLGLSSSSWLGLSSSSWLGLSSSSWLGFLGSWLGSSRLSLWFLSCCCCRCRLCFFLGCCRGSCRFLSSTSSGCPRLLGGSFLFSRS
ncbi:hypothetical protein WDU94_004555, partial [Cyamophila willieti]